MELDDTKEIGKLVKMNTKFIIYSQTKNYYPKVQPNSWGNEFGTVNLGINCKTSMQIIM